jgi:hypothetical protein
MVDCIFPMLAVPRSPHSTAVESHLQDRGTMPCRRLAVCHCELRLGVGGSEPCEAMDTAADPEDEHRTDSSTPSEPSAWGVFNTSSISSLKP